MLKNFERTSGKKAGARASLHEYEGATAKLEIELSLKEAQALMEQAVTAGGRLPLKLSFGNRLVEAVAVGARIDSFDLAGQRSGGTGVIEFSSLKLK